MFFKRIYELRVDNDLTQQQVAEQLSLTQVKVSREEKKIFAALRAQLTK